MSETQSSLPQLAERLKSVRVGVRKELEVSRHVFRGTPAYVVRDPLTFQSHKFSASDYQVFTAIHPEKQLGAIFAQLCTSDRIEAEREEDFYRFVLRLAQIGLLSLPVSDGKSLYDRFMKRREASRKSRLTSVLFLRVPLFQPDAFLSRTIHWTSRFFTKTALAIWCIGLIFCTMLVAAQWQEMCSPLGTMLATQNLPILWALLVGLKVIHEFGHAYACKHFGGRVPEMGAYFILFTPCAYVDASASWGFTNRLHRMVVGLAGMYFESVAAMIAVVVWSLTGPGVVHSAAQYAVVLSTVVTIGFNANPLMKYDGYFVLTDMLGMADLRGDATRQLNSYLKRLLLGVDAQHVSPTRWGRSLLTGFGAASAMYKVIVMLGICILIAFKIPVVGAGVALVFGGTMLMQLGRKLFQYVMLSDELATKRRRAVTVAVCASLLAITALMLLPMPGAVRATGVVERSEDRVLRAGVAGFLYEVGVEEGELLAPGAVVCRLENLELTSALEQTDAELEQLRILLQGQIKSDLVAAARTERMIEQTRQDRRRLGEDVTSLVVMAPVEGQVAQADGLKQLGRYVREGEPLATVGAGSWQIKTLVDAESLADTIPQLGDRVGVRLIGHAGRTLAGNITRIGRAGRRKIEDAALTLLGGGEIAVSEATMEAESPYFELTIVLDDHSEHLLRHGMTALVHLSGTRSSIGSNLYRRALRLLNHLRVAS